MRHTTGWFWTGKRGRFHFISLPEFLSKAAQNVFVEYNHYGDIHFCTTTQAFLDKVEKQRIVLVEANAESFRQMKAARHFDARYVLIKPPSLHIPEEQVRSMNNSTEDQIQNLRDFIKRSWMICYAYP